MHKSNRVVLFAFTILLCSLLACQQFPIAATPASSLHLEQGRQALTDERYDEAISELTTAIADDANNAEAYYLRGSAYYGRYETAYSNNDPNADGDDFYRAVTDFTKAIELSHNYAEAYDFRGLTFHGLHQPDHALADYNMAIQLNPGLAQAYYGRGLVYEEQGETDKAIADYKHFLKLNDDPYWEREAEKRLTDLGASP
ncbi:MAG TPA: tetratricopeptide repeat protein [Anaerolineales bacterium]|nr:tetratricopeptide repeat protein [Anaerolineales bacterium]